MAIIASDDFAGAGTASIGGRTLNNALGGSGTRTWGSIDTVNMLGDGAGAVQRAASPTANNHTSISGAKVVRIKFDPAGGTSAAYVGLRRADLSGGNTAGLSLVLTTSQTSLQIREYTGAGFTTQSTATVTAPGAVMYLEMQIDDVAGQVIGRILNSDTTVRDTVTWSYTTLPTGDYAGFGFGNAGSTGTFDDFVLDDGPAADTQAPTLTSATGTATGATTANGSVTSDEAASAWAVITTSATAPSAAQVKAAQNHAGASAAASDTGTLVNGANTNVFGFTGLTASTTYYMHVVADDAVPNTSTVASSASFTTSAAADTTAPVLTSPTAVAMSNALIVAGVTTDEANGTLYVVATTSATPPTAAQIRAGQNNSGTAAVFAANQAIGSTGAKTFNVTGLTQLTLYYLYFHHRDAANNDSTVSSASDTTYRNGATGQYILDNTGPIGGNPAGILYNDVQVGDEAKWFSFVITTPPATGTLVIDPDGTFTYTGPAETMYYQLEVDGANVGSPVLVELFSGSFFRPLGDVTTTGWTSTGATLYAAINELAADDADYITSPDVAGTPGSYTFDLPSMAAGTYTRRMRMKKTGSTGEARLVFLDAGAASVGTTAWIALTASWATYEASVTLTGTAVRGRIEVRA